MKRIGSAMAALVLAATITGCGGGTTGIEDQVKAGFIGTPGSVFIENVDQFTASWHPVEWWTPDGVTYWDLSEDSGATWCRRKINWDIDTANTQSESNFVIRWTYAQTACGAQAGATETYQYEKLEEHKYRFLLFTGQIKDLSTTAQLYYFRCSRDLKNRGGPCDINGGDYGPNGRPTGLAASPY